MVPEVKKKKKKRNNRQLFFSQKVFPAFLLYSRLLIIDTAYKKKMSAFSVTKNRIFSNNAPYYFRTVSAFIFHVFAGFIIFVFDFNPECWRLSSRIPSAPEKYRLVGTV